MNCAEHTATTMGGRCYWHTKEAVLEGKPLSLDARNWVGFDIPEPKHDEPNGWRPATSIRSWSYELLDRERMSPEDRQLVYVLSGETAQALQDASQDVAL